MSETTSQKRDVESRGPSWLSNRFPDSPPWSASLGAVGLALTALYHISLDGQPLEGTGPTLSLLSGEFTVSLEVKIGLLMVALIASAFAVGIRRVDWGLFPFVGVVLGFVVSIGYALWMGLGAGTVQAQQVNQLASLSAAFFLIGVIVTLWQLHHSRTALE
jgi:hypothetical protein